MLIDRACSRRSRSPPATISRSQQTNQPTIKVRSAEQEQLHKLDAFNLAIALKRAIYDAGYTCKRITDAGFVGTCKNLDMWMAHCVYDKGSRATGRSSPVPTAAPRCATARTFAGHRPSRHARSSSARRAASPTAK